MEERSYEDIFFNEKWKIDWTSLETTKKYLYNSTFLFLLKSENNNAINKKNNKKQKLKSLWTQTWKNESAVNKWKHSS